MRSLRTLPLHHLAAVQAALRRFVAWHYRQRFATLRGLRMFGTCPVFLIVAGWHIVTLLVRARSECPVTEIPLFYDKHVEVKFSDRAGPGSHNGYTRGFPTNGARTLKLQMESANLSSTTDESRVQLISLEYDELRLA